MATATFDTLKFANALKAVGVPDKQAEAEAQVLSEVFSINFREVTTKEDLKRAVADIEVKIREVEQRLLVKIDQNAAKIDQFRLELNSKIDQFKTELSAKMELVDKKLDAKIEQNKTDLTAKIDQVKTELLAKIDMVEKKLDAKIDLLEKKLDAKIDQVKTELSAKIDLVEKKLDAKMDSIQLKLSGEMILLRWMFGVVISFLVAMLALLIRVYLSTKPN